MSDQMQAFERKAAADIATTDDERRLLVLQGVGLAVFGITTMVLPYATSLRTSAVVGWMLFMSALFRLATGFSAKIAAGHWSSMLVATLTIPFGAVLVLYPMPTLAELKLGIAGYLAVHGLGNLVLAATLRQDTRRSLAIPIGSALDFALVGLLFDEWPTGQAWVLALYLGISLSLAGSILAFVALGLKGHARRHEIRGRLRDPHPDHRE